MNNIFFKLRILTSVNCAIFVNGGEDTRKWIASFVLNLVTSQQLEPL